MTVSIKDFNLWLTQNKRWSQYKNEKVDLTPPQQMNLLSHLIVLQVRRMDEKHQQEIDATISQPK
jgi:hypothetical protein